MKRILALDLGTRTGWSESDGDKLLSHGNVLLATDKELRAQKKIGDERARDIRVLRLYDFIINKSPTHIIFEDVLFCKSQAQAQLWASFRSAVWLAGRDANIRCVDVPTLKKFATGAGNADKNMMRQHLEWRHKLIIEDDNEVDAVWLMFYGVEHGVDRRWESIAEKRKRKNG